LVATLLRVRGLSVSLNGYQALQAIDLEAAPGQIVAVVGPNGAGKTTLIRAISGVIPAQAGAISIGGKDLAGLSTQERARHHAVVPQARELPPAFTVWQTVALGRTPHLGWLGRLQQEDEAFIQATLENVGLTGLADRTLEKLSSGEQQRVLIARALAQNASLLLLDEPTAHLDLHHQSGILQLIRALAQAQNLAVVMVLHDLNLVAHFADHVAVIVAGKLFASGAPGEALAEKTLAAAYQTPIRVLHPPGETHPIILIANSSQK
jgi:iron complex transport system ATP-binding protein